MTSPPVSTTPVANLLPVMSSAVNLPSVLLVLLILVANLPLGPISIAPNSPQVSMTPVPHCPNCGRCFTVRQGVHIPKMQNDICHKSMPAVLRWSPRKGSPSDRYGGRGGGLLRTVPQCYGTGTNLRASQNTHCMDTGSPPT